MGRSLGRRYGVIGLIAAQSPSNSFVDRGAIRPMASPPEAYFATSPASLQVRTLERTRPLRVLPQLFFMESAPDLVTHSGP